MNTVSAKTPVGFIGAGAMGGGMIANLRKNGFAVSFYARDTPRGRDTSRRLEGLGALRVADLAALGAAVEVIVLCLPDSPAVESILLDRKGLRSRLKRGAIVLDCSSSHPASTRRLAADLGQDDISLLDAPLTGSRGQAEAGTLSVLGAGPLVAFEQAKPVMHGFASRVFYLGQSGAGHTAKLINNYLFQLALAGLCESWPLIREFGIDQKALFDAISVSGGNSAMFQGIFPRYQKGDFSLNFAQRLANKDVRYFTEVAREAKVPSPMGTALLALHEDATARGFGDQDITALLKYYQALPDDSKTGR